MDIKPTDLAFAWNLPPAKAIEYFRSKGYTITWAWEDLWAQAQVWSFTVAKAMTQDVLESIRAELERSLETGETFATFRKNLEPRLRALGWWGNAAVLAPGGALVNVQLGSVRRLETIFRTNTQTAYSVGRWSGFTAASATHPYLRYVTKDDGRVRDSHRGLHNRVFPINDPIWKFIGPPNGFNCRCRVKAYSASMLERDGLVSSSSGDDLKVTSVVDPASGLVYEQATYQSRGMDKPFAPDKGWSYNPGMAWQTPFRNRVPV
jgi:SPP1 gp7 family putative phage head morphogenesis protein